ncbi:MAG: UbiA family prenyltransferase [Desulfurococcales archaeon]|nr:UbiA family prenyltransferase [Desulfurococcales archaeon]
MSKKILYLLQMTKPTQLLLLSITMFGAYFIAGGGADPRILLLLALTALGSAGGVTALNMYLEHDIDFRMPRTRARPLPSGKLSRAEALVGVSMLIILGTLASSFINKWVLLTTLVGLYFDIIAYTELAKRRTEWSLLFGSIAGSMPALGGWAAGAGSIGMNGILLAAMVYVWQPLHVAFIHYYYGEDYEAAKIPTIPGRLGHRKFASLVKLSVFSLIVLVWIFLLLNGYGLISALLVSFLGAKALKAVKVFANNPEKSYARAMIKYASPMIAVAFVMIPLEKTLGFVVLDKEIVLVHSVNVLEMFLG